MDLQDTAPADVDAFEKAAGLEVDRLRRAAAGKGLVAESPGHDSEDEIDRQLAEAQRQQKLLEEREQRKEAKRRKLAELTEKLAAAASPSPTFSGSRTPASVPPTPPAQAAAALSTAFKAAPAIKPVRPVEPGDEKTPAPEAKASDMFKTSAFWICKFLPSARRLRHLHLHHLLLHPLQLGVRVLLWPVRARTPAGRRLRW